MKEKDTELNLLQKSDKVLSKIINTVKWHATEGENDTNSWQIINSQDFFFYPTKLLIRQFNVGFYTLLIILIIFKLCMRYILVKFSGASSK